MAGVRLPGMTNSPLQPGSRAPRGNGSPGGLSAGGGGGGEQGSITISDIEATAMRRDLARLGFADADGAALTGQMREATNTPPSQALALSPQVMAQMAALHSSGRAGLAAAHQGLAANPHFVAQVAPFGRGHLGVGSPAALGVAAAPPPNPNIAAQMATLGGGGLAAAAAAALPPNLAAAAAAQGQIAAVASAAAAAMSAMERFNSGASARPLSAHQTSVTTSAITSSTAPFVDLAMCDPWGMQRIRSSAGTQTHAFPLEPQPLGSSYDLSWAWEATGDGGRSTTPPQRQNAMLESQLMPLAMVSEQPCVVNLNVWSFNHRRPTSTLDKPRISIPKAVLCRCESRVTSALLPSLPSPLSQSLSY